MQTPPGGPLGSAILRFIYILRGKEKLSDLFDKWHATVADDRESLADDGRRESLESQKWHYSIKGTQKTICITQYSFLQVYPN